MADANKTLITRAELDSNINAAVGRRQLTFDGASTDAASFTGIRDITGLLTAGQFTSGRVLVARKDDQVIWFFNNLVLPAASEGLNWSIMAGNQLPNFRPFYTATHDYKTGSDGHVARLAVSPDAQLFVQFAKAARSISTTLLTFTQAGWPSTLPGVADGAPVVV